MTSVKDQLDILGKQVATRISGLERAIKDGGDAIDKLVESNRQAQESLNTLLDKKRSAEHAALASDVGVSPHSVFSGPRQPTGRLVS